MSFLSHAYLLEKYGLRVNLKQLGEVLNIAPGSIRNQVSKGVFLIPTYVDQGQRFADYRDVAEYLDQARKRAQTGARP